MCRGKGAACRPSRGREKHGESSRYLREQRMKLSIRVISIFEAMPNDINGAVALAEKELSGMLEIVVKDSRGDQTDILLRNPQKKKDGFHAHIAVVETIGKNIIAYTRPYGVERRLARHA